MNKTFQDLKMEIEALKKTQTERIQEMENLGKRIATTDISNFNRIKQMEDKISGVEDTIEEIDTLVKENDKSKRFLTQNIQEIWDTVKDQT
jgi:TolA-binding protein